MSLKSFLAKQFAKSIYKKTKLWSDHPVQSQQTVFKEIIRQAKNTQFGIDHDFDTINTFQDFSKKVPVRDYEALKPYIDRERAPSLRNLERCL